MMYENDKTPGRYKRIVKRGFNDVIYVIQQQDKNFYPAVLCKNKNAKAFLIQLLWFYYFLTYYDCI